mmetsp:Transcript_24054/g.52077  ORF Transcript_24054/g.52077 Transcript_24054/m.52077 type:complete len:324 (+) Transcript_24054:185-1156(+)
MHSLRRSLISATSRNFATSPCSRFVRGGASRRYKSTTSADARQLAEEVSNATPLPTRPQLKRLFLRAAIPMVGFGFMDQSVMLHAGNAIDCTLGVSFGLSTLTAAAFGQFFSDSAGVLFGGALERLATVFGIPSSGLTSAQRALPLVRRLRVLGGLAGVLLGCSLGLLNLLIIDTERSPILKLRQFSQENEFAFHIEASNSERDDATVLTVRGPDVDGFLASLTSTLSANGYSLLELSAKKSGEDVIEDVFVVVKMNTREQVPDEELDELAQTLLEATRSPLNANAFKEKVHGLEDENAALRSRLHRLEGVIRKSQIDIVASN